MDYQIWKKDEFGDTWNREDCGDKEAAMRAILAARQAGKEVVMTIEVPFELKIELGEPGEEKKPPKVPKKKPDEDKSTQEDKSGPDKSQSEGD